MKKLLTILFILFSFQGLQSQQVVVEDAKQILRTSANDTAKYRAALALEFFYTESDYDSAFTYMQKATDLARKLGYPILEAMAQNGKAYTYMKQRKYDLSFTTYQECFIMADKPPIGKGNATNGTIVSEAVKSIMLGHIHHNFGHLMGATGNVEQQLFHYYYAKAIADRYNDSILLCLVNMNIGWVKLGWVKMNGEAIDSAIMYEKIAKNIATSSNYKRYLGVINYLLSNCYLKKGMLDLAKQNSYEGIALSGSEANHFALLQNMITMSSIYLQEKNKDSSLAYALKSKTFSEIQKEDEYMPAVFINLFNSYELANKMDSAYKYQGLAIVALDSNNARENRSLNEFKNINFSERIRLQNIEREKLLSQGRIRTFTLLGGISLLILLAGIFYRNSRQKQKAHDRIQTAYSELRDTQQQLIQREKMASLGELTAGIAHEIQNPLNFVNNFSELSQELLTEMDEEADKGNIEEVKAISADIKQNLEKINHHGRRADSIVKGMLQHSQKGSGLKEPTDINALADEYLRLSYHGFRAKDNTMNASIVTDLDDSIGKIDLVQQDISRVLLNLFNNAFYAAAEMYKTVGENFKPIVTLTTRKNKDHIEITVKDNGSGIPEAVKGKIFQPFFTTKPTGQGTGLGLSLSYDIIKAHGGTITVNSKNNETLFIIELPVNS